MSVVYKLVNQKNGATCVGITQMTAQARLDELKEFAKDTALARTKLPCKKIVAAMLKYGAENFEIIPLVEGIYSTEQLETMELVEIQKLNDAGITVYHRTGTFIPGQEKMDRICSSEDDDNFFYG